MRKLVASAMTTALLMGSMITVAMANEQNTTPVQKGSLSSHSETSPFGVSSVESKNVQPTTYDNQKMPLETLREQKEQITAQINSTGFSALSLSEKLSLFKQSFELQKEIHNEYKTLILAFHVAVDLGGLEKTIYEEQSSLKKEYQSFEESLLKAKKNNHGEVVESKELLTEIMSLIKDNRSTGRQLQSMIDNKQKSLNAKEITVLQQVAINAIQKNEKKQAVESLSKILKLSEGDPDYLSLLYKLLNDEESYILFNNDLILLSEKYKQFEDSDEWYISLGELEEFMDIEIKKTKQENEEEEIIESISIEHNGNQLVYKNNQMTFNDVSIGNPSVWATTTSQEMYVNAEFIFEVFGYYTERSSQKEVLIINKPVFPIQEIDEFPVEELVNSIVKS